MNMPPQNAFFFAVLLVVIGSFIRPGASHPFRNFTTHLDPSTRLWEKESLFAPHLWQSSSTIELPALWRTITALVCGATATAISSAGGIVGGGLYVPIFNLLLGFSSKTSAALSSCMIVGGTFVTLVWSSRQRKANGAGPLIDYQLSLLCLPNVLLGICGGVMFNVASPAWLVTLVLVMSFFLMTFRSWHIAHELCKMETSALQALRTAISSTAISRKDGASGADDAALDKDKDLEKPLLDPQPKSLAPQYPMLKIAVLCIIWVAFLAVQIVRGSSDGQNFFNIQACSALYWIVTAAQVPFAFIATACIMLHLRKMLI